jgi:predicted nucleic acid-binding protein
LADAVDPLVLDTDVASLIIGKQIDLAASGLYGRTWCVSFVTVGELAKGAAMAKQGLRRWTELATWLSKVIILPYNVQVSNTWGQLAAAAQLRGRARPVNDMWIAAVCLSNGLALATHNLKDFADFAEHHRLVLHTG